MVVWWKRWAVYVPVSDEDGPSMREDGHPVFADKAGRWWGERLGARYWTRGQARRVALRDDRSKRGMTAFAAALSGALPRVEAPTRTARVGLAGESGWYSRPSTGVPVDGRAPWRVWALLAFAGLVMPVGLLVVDLVAPAADGWLLLLGGAAAVVAAVVAAGWVLRRAASGGR